MWRALAGTIATLSSSLSRIIINNRIISAQPSVHLI
jgi:hypothetical protein